MLRGPAFFDYVAFPGNIRIKMGVGIFPPPDFVALPIATEYNVRVTVAIDVIDRAAGFDGEEARVQHVTIPAGDVAAIPHQGRRNLAETNHEIISTVLVEVHHEGSGLLGRCPGHG